MLISPIISQIKKYCSIFKGNVAGGIDWDVIQNSAKLPLPAAYVVMASDDAEASTANVVLQNLKDYFDVVVVIRNADERGQAAADIVHHIRKELFRALIGFVPDKDYDHIEYDSGQLLDISRATTVYQYRFYSYTGIGRTIDNNPPETWEEVEKDGLAMFEHAHIDTDVIDPIVDHNLKETGPDGRIEFQTDIKPNKGNKP